MKIHQHFKIAALTSSKPKNVFENHFKICMFLIMSRNFILLLLILKYRRFLACTHLTFFFYIKDGLSWWLLLLICPLYAKCCFPTVSSIVLMAWQVNGGLINLCELAWGTAIIYEVLSWEKIFEISNLKIFWIHSVHMGLEDKSCMFSLTWGILNDQAVMTQRVVLVGRQ